MRKLIIALSVLSGMLFFLSGAFAAHHQESPTTDAGKAMHRTMYGGYFATMLDRVDREVSLTAEQKAKAKAIFDDADAKFRQLHEEVSAKMKAVLTKEQLEKWEGVKAKWHNRSHEGKPGSKSE